MYKAVYLYKSPYMEIIAMLRNVEISTNFTHCNIHGIFKSPKGFGERPHWALNLDNCIPIARIGENIHCDDMSTGGKQTGNR